MPPPPSSGQPQAVGSQPPTQQPLSGTSPSTTSPTTSSDGLVDLMTAEVAAAHHTNGTCDLIIVLSTDLGRHWVESAATWKQHDIGEPQPFSPIQKMLCGFQAASYLAWPQNFDNMLQAKALPGSVVISNKANTAKFDLVTSFELTDATLSNRSDCLRQVGSKHFEI